MGILLLPRLQRQRILLLREGLLRLTCCSVDMCKSFGCRTAWKEYCDKSVRYGRYSQGLILSTAVLDDLSKYIHQNDKCNCRQRRGLRIEEDEGLPIILHYKGFYGPRRLLVRIQKFQKTKTGIVWYDKPSRARIVRCCCYYS